MSVLGLAGLSLCLNLSLNVTKPEIDNDLMSIKPNSSWPHTEGGRAEFDALVQVKI